MYIYIYIYIWPRGSYQLPYYGVGVYVAIMARLGMYFQDFQEEPGYRQLSDLVQPECIARCLYSGASQSGVGVGGSCGCSCGCGGGGGGGGGDGAGAGAWG